MRGARATRGSPGYGATLQVPISSRIPPAKLTAPESLHFVSVPLGD
jgi:hypothetical protein